MLTRLDIEKYFIAEKSESILFIIIGLVAAVLSIVLFFFLKSSFCRGTAVPLLLIAIIQVVVGYTVYARSDKQRIDIVYAYDMNPGKLQQEELPRMIKVNTNFVLIRWVEIALLVAGLALLFMFKNDESKQFLYGFGVALAIQAIVMLTADYFAEKRAKEYAYKLEAFINRRN